jgi:hypothetical protein
VDVLGVGDDHVALLAAQRTGRGEVLVGVEEEAQQRGAPRDLVGLEDGDLFGRGFVVGLELRVEIEGRLVDAWRRSAGRDRRVDRASPPVGDSGGHPEVASEKCRAQTWT